MMTPLERARVPAIFVAAIILPCAALLETSAPQVVTPTAIAPQPASTVAPQPASRVAPQPASRVAAQPAVVRKMHDDWISDCYQRGPIRTDDTRLQKADIVKGISEIKPRVSECFDRFGVRGLANVAVEISAKGRVTWAQVSGSFAHTPTGTCVENAVATATFPQAVRPTQVNYPFMLR
jgi:hypothetical protein